MDPIETLAHLMFDAYAVDAGGRTHDDKPIPRWDGLTDAVRQHWRVAALTACDFIQRMGEDEIGKVVEALAQHRAARS